MNKIFNTWRDYSTKCIRAELLKRKTSITALQIQRDTLQAKFTKDPTNDKLLSDIRVINRRIAKAKKPILERELYLNQGVRVTR